MFSCIYLKEDASLSVVRKDDKNLELLGEYRPRESVVMKWGKKQYTGTIIKIGDSEEAATKFATKAYNKILKDKAKEGIPDKVPEELFSVSFGSYLDVQGKRERKKTKKIEASLEQGQQFSPQKKRKTEIRDSNRCTSEGKNAESSKKRGKSETGEQSHTLVLSNILSQFNDTSPELTATSQSHGQNETFKDTLKENISFSETWTECQRAMAACSTPLKIHDIQGPSTLCTESASDRFQTTFLATAPSKDVLTFFSLLVKPEVQEFARTMLDNFAGDAVSGLDKSGARYDVHEDFHQRRLFFPQPLGMQADSVARKDSTVTDL